MPATCPICHERSRDGLPCHDCWRKHRRRVEALPSLDQELETTITRQDQLGPAASEVRSSSLFGPLPVNIDASYLRDHLRATLVSWVRAMCEGHQHPYPADTVIAMCEYLADTRALRRHVAAPEMVDELRALHGQCMAAIDYPDERGRIKVGPCPEHDDEGEPCGGLTWAHLPEGNAPTFIRCDCCTREWSSIEWTSLGRGIARKLEQRRLAQRWAVG